MTSINLCLQEFIRYYRKTCKRRMSSRRASRFAAGRKSEHLVKEIAIAITKGGFVPARLLSRQLRIDAIQLIAMRNKTVIK